MLPGWLYEYSSTFKGRLKMQLGLCPMSVVCVHSNLEIMGNLCHSIFVQQRITPVLDPICPFTGTALLSQLRLLFLLLALFQLEALELAGLQCCPLYAERLVGHLLVEAGEREVAERLRQRPVQLGLRGRCRAGRRSSSCRSRASARWT